jgi:hypothetical protein
MGKLVRVFFANAGLGLTPQCRWGDFRHGLRRQPGEYVARHHYLRGRPSDGAVFEFTLNRPGNYPFMDLNRASQY